MTNGSLALYAFMLAFVCAVVGVIAISKPWDEL